MAGAASLSDSVHRLWCLKTQFTRISVLFLHPPHLIGRRDKGQRPPRLERGSTPGSIRGQEPQLVPAEGPKFPRESGQSRCPEEPTASEREHQARLWLRQPPTKARTVEDPAFGVQRRSRGFPRFWLVADPAEDCFSAGRSSNRPLGLVRSFVPFVSDCGGLGATNEFDGELGTCP